MEFWAPCLFFDVIVLLSEQWMWLGMSAGGQIRSYYMYPEGREGALPPTGHLLMSVFNFHFQFTGV